MVYECVFFGEILEESKTAGQIVFWRLQRKTTIKLILLDKEKKPIGLESTTNYLKDEEKLL